MPRCIVSVRNWICVRCVPICAGVCPQFTPALFQKAAEAAALTGYRFDKYKTTPTAPGIESAAFLCEMPERYEAALVEAEVSAEATCIARDLINGPPTVLTPAKLAQAAVVFERHVKVTDLQQRWSASGSSLFSCQEGQTTSLSSCHGEAGAQDVESRSDDRQGPYLRQRRIPPPVV